MVQATFTELRAQAKHFFDLVESGQTVRIVRSGRPIADIHPVLADVPSWKQRKARPLAVSGSEIAQLIIDERGS